MRDELAMLQKLRDALKITSSGMNSMSRLRTNTMTTVNFVEATSSSLEQFRPRRFMNDIQGIESGFAANAGKTTNGARHQA